MELLTRLRPLKCSFDLDVPSRNASWYLDSGYEPFTTAIFRSACRVADVIVDIGAHVGYFSCLAASANPLARVIAVEASPENGSLVSSNATLNDFKIEMHNAAFGSTSGNVKFHIAEASDNCGLSGHPNSPTLVEINIDAITGDALAITPGLRLIVKIDVEGHELSALRGIENLLAGASDIRLLIELNPKCISHAGEDPLEILKWIWDHGFRIFGLDEIAHTWIEVSEPDILEKIGSGYMNLWCIPSASAMTLCAVMHSAALGGAERSHIEVVEDLIGAGFMINTIMPAPDMGLVNELRGAGSSTTLLSPYPWWVVNKNHPLPFESKANWQVNLISQDVIEAIKKVDPEVVLTQTIVIPQGAIAALALGKPHVWWIREFAELDHDLVLPLSPEQTGKLVASLSAKVFTNSSAVRDYFFPSNPDMACVIHPTPRLRTSHASLLNPDRPWTFGIVGGLHPGKGHKDALHALVALIEEGLDLKMICIGSGSEEDFARLNALAKKLRIDSHVTFMGQIEGGPNIYDLIDAVAVTSRSEAFGRVPFEATEAGRPVIYSKGGGMVEYMIDGQTGLGYTPGDPGELAQALKLLLTNPELGQRLVDTASIHFHKLFRDSSKAGLLVKALVTSRDAQLEDIQNNLIAWLTKSAIQNNSAVAERDSAVAERDSAVAERDSSVAERDRVLNSTIWKISKPYRWLRSKI